MANMPVLDGLRRAEDLFSPLIRATGGEGYHSRKFKDGPYPVEAAHE